jgi:histidine ammonia-lyase
LYDKSISANDIEQLQENLVISHACGMGEEISQEVVRLMMLLKIQGLSLGYSAISLEVVERLIFFYNQGVLPVIYSKGSLGASGDLAPLAHLVLPLIGKGEVYYKGVKQGAETLHQKLKIAPLTFRSKEALALLNGTQFMSSFSVWIMFKAKKLAHYADLIAALSLEAYDGRPEPFNENLHKVRAHKGQLTVAKNIRGFLKGSQLIAQKKKHVQDPYSFRCVPQVHGASRDMIAYAESVFLTEINSVTDNPTVFPDEDKILSGGNFHGQPLAIALDSLAIALAELGNISERRTYQLISGQRGLPMFLVSNPGLNSGFMIPQYTAASIVSANKQLCTPASVDSIVSSNGQEDHVSMGANAATQCYEVVNNVERILAIELFTAAQAFEFRRPFKSSAEIEKFFSCYRKKVPFIKEDVVMYELMEKTVNFLKS